MDPNAYLIANLPAAPRDLQIAPADTGGDINGTVLGVFNGVVQDVEDNLPKMLVVGLNQRQTLRAVYGNGSVLIGRLTLETVLDLGNGIEDIDGPKVEDHFALLEPARIEEFIDDGNEPNASSMNIFDHIAQLRAFDFVGVVIEHHVHVAADGGERRAELVRSDGEEFFARTLENAYFGDVLKDDGGAGNDSVRHNGGNEYDI